MKPHKILVKRKKSFKLDHQKNKFALLIGEDGRLDNELPLDRTDSDPSDTVVTFPIPETETPG